MREATEAAETKKEKEKEAGGWRRMPQRALFFSPAWQSPCKPHRDNPVLHCSGPSHHPALLTADSTSPRRPAHPAGKAVKEAGSSSPENAFIRGSITLHDKYMEYVQVRYGGGVGRQQTWKAGVLDAASQRNCMCALRVAATSVLTCSCSYVTAGIVWQLLTVPQGP